MGIYTLLLITMFAYLIYDYYISKYHQVYESNYIYTLTWIHNRFVTYFMGMLLPVQGIVIKYGTHDSHHGRVLNMYMCARAHTYTQNCNLLQLSKYGRILYPLDSRTKNKNERAKFPAGMCLTSKHWSLLLKCAKSSSLVYQNIRDFKFLALYLCTI